MRRKKRRPATRAPVTDQSAGDRIDATTSLRHDFIVAVKRALRESHASRNSLLLLFAVNGYTIVMAVYEDWSIVSVLFAYWCQNLIVGFFVTVKLLVWPNIVFAAEDAAGMPEAAAKRFKLRNFLALFITLHGLMAFFALQVIDIAELKAPTLWYAIGLFALNHALSFALNYRQDTATPTTGGWVMLEGIIRLLPLWLLPPILFVIYVPMAAVWTLAGGDDQVLSGAWLTVVPFMVVKTFTEILTHLATHSSARSAGTGTRG